MMKLKLKGKVYQFDMRNVWGPLYTYEEITGNKLPFNPHRALCLHILYYAILLRCNDDVTLTLDGFLECLNNVELVNSITEYYNKRMEVLTAGAADNAVVDDEAEADKKKD